CDQSLLQLYREVLVNYVTARDAATNPFEFDLKVKGIFSTGEMTWEVNSPGAVGAPGAGRPSAAPSAARLPAPPTAPPKRG
ncbi:MAG: type IV pili twitching motility protein PilT, partial [Candidatus Rokubacteria bacterium]|nr:type IV pili twitching motility protein PilT [Candidatus Rokubacteria bacterium]